MDEGQAGQGRKAWLVAAGVLVAAVAMVVAVVAVGDEDGPSDGTAKPLALVRPGTDATSAAGDSYEQAVEYHLDGELPDLGTNGRVYRMTQPSMSMAEVERIADAIGAEGDVQADGQGGWTVVNQDSSLSVSDVGAGWTITYGAGMRFASIGGPVDATTGTALAATTTTIAPGAPVPSTEPALPDYWQPPTPSSVPDVAEAEQIARRVLGDMDVLDGEWQAEVNDVAMATTARACVTGSPCPPQPSTDPVVGMRSVTLQRVLDGQPVAGLEWNVTVADLGAIQSLSGVHTRLEEAVDYPLMTTQAAFDALVAGTAFLAQPMSTGRTFATVGSAIASTDGSSLPSSAVRSAPPEHVVTITGAERGAAVVGASEGGVLVGYVVPTYRFVARAQYGEGQHGEWSVEVVAVDPSLVAPVDDVPVPQPGISEPMPSETSPAHRIPATVPPDIRTDTTR